MASRLSGALVFMALIAGSSAVARAETSSALPSGTTLSVDIDAPLDGATIPTGSTLTISGSAAVGEAPAVKNTDVVFVIDTSGSTASDSGLTCGTILDCEKAAVLELVAQASAARSPIGNVGVAAFPDTDVLGLVAPNSTSIGTFLDSLTASGGTDFSDGLSRTRPLLAASAADQKLVVFLTDGDGTLNSEETPVDAVVKAFAVAGQGCSASLQGVVALGSSAESACTVVTDLGLLSGVIQETIGSSLDSVEVTVDDVQEYLDATSTPGPTSRPFSVDVSGLTAGSHEVCATATGSDASGSGSAHECVSITVQAPGTVVVDCSAPTGNCTATAQDPGKSTLTFSAPAAFDETVTIVPNTGAPGSCGGQNCRTGYDILFPTTSANGPIVSLTVVTAKKVTAREWRQAAVYLDGVRITKQCSNRIIIKRIRDRFGRPEPIPCMSIKLLRNGHIEYFLKFKADPGARFR